MASRAAWPHRRAREQSWISGGPVELPDTWSVLYNDALFRWLDHRPPEQAVDAVVVWLDERQGKGPPDDAVQIYADEDLYYSVVSGSTVDGASVVITYLLVVDDRERLIIVREIT